MIDKILLETIKSNLAEAIRVILANKVRTFLTALGIIFGVAAVITMLAIGKGAEQEILAQLELVGVNNIVPTVKKLSPEIILETYMIKKGRQSAVKLIGVTDSFFETSNVHIGQGKNFTEIQARNALPVCIIGEKVEKKLFTGESAIGKRIKVKDVWLKVVGIIKEKLISETAQENLGIRDLNQDIYVPIKTFLVRYKDRKILSDQPLDLGGGGMIIVGGNNGGPKKRKPRGNYHQIDKLTVQVNNSNELKATAEVISRMLKRKLLIGGIGIMNIMLASILERTKEIGIMKAIGATKQDIILQFLSESILISLGGGIIGCLLGIISSYILEIATDIETIVSVGSILLSFLVATFIGLIFGVLPAKSAANKNPIEAIRHE